MLPSIKREESMRFGEYRIMLRLRRRWTYAVYLREKPISGGIRATREEALEKAMSILRRLNVLDREEKAI